MTRQRAAEDKLTGRARTTSRTSRPWPLSSIISAPESKLGSQRRRTDMASKIVCAMMRIALVLSIVAPAAAQGREIKVTLLGTGSPPAVMNRFGPSILVEAGAQKFLFDAGRGALQRLNQVKVRWRDVQGVFLTHLHS